MEQQLKAERSSEMFFFLYIFIYIYSMCRKCLVVVEVLLAVLPMLFEMFFHTNSHDILPEEDASNGTEYTKKKKKIWVHF